MKTVGVRPRRLPGMSGIAVLAVGLACLGPVGAARAQRNLQTLQTANSIETKREGLRAELREIDQALKKNQIDLVKIRRLSGSPQKKKAELERTAADLKKREARVRVALRELAREAPSPIVFPPPSQPGQSPVLIFPDPKPSPPKCRWPPPWPPPILWEDRCPGPKIYPLGTPGNPVGIPQGVSPLLPGIRPQ